MLLPHAGCREKIDFNFPDFEQVTTINSILAADSVFKLHLSTTNKMSHDTLPVIKNAEIQLFINGNFEQTLNYEGNGIYAATNAVVSQNTYRCEFFTTDNQKIIAESEIPVYTQFEELKYYKNGWINSDGFACPAVDFSIKNDTTVKKYYQVWVFDFYGSPLWDISSYQLAGYKPFALFNNISEKGNTINKRIEFEPNIYGTSDGIEDAHTYIIELRTVSGDYYEYAESLELYEQGRFPEFDVSTAVPHNLYSNVENGYGIFASYAATRTDSLY